MKRSYTNFFTKHPQQVIFGFISLKLNNIMVKASHLVKMVSRWLAEKRWVYMPWPQ